MTSSALSQTVSHLEHHIGVSLFERIGRKMVPTKAALQLHHEFRKSQKAFLDGMQSLETKEKSVTGVLRLGSYQEFAKSHLTSLIADFIEEYPQVQIKMTFDTPSRLISLLEEGSLDICFSIYPAKGKKTISSISIYEEELVLISQKEKFEGLSLERLARSSIIEYYSNHQPIRRWFKLHYDKQLKKIPIRIFASTAEMVLSLVKSGAGMGIVPLYLVNEPEILKNIKVIRPTSKKMTDYIWLLQKDSLAKTNAHQVFIQKLKKRFTY